jgi:hypothetical protein
MVLKERRGTTQSQYTESVKARIRQNEASSLGARFMIDRVISWMIDRVTSWVIDWVTSQAID